MIAESLRIFDPSVPGDEQKAAFSPGCENCKAGEGSLFRRTLEVIASLTQKGFRDETK
jgi:hypothetical protein